MRTNELIALLSAAPPARPVWGLSARLITVALAAGCVTCALFLAVVGTRPDLLAALADPRVMFKFVFAAGCLAAGLLMCPRLIDPRTPPPLWPLAIPAVVVVAGAALEMILTPDSSWFGAMVGQAPLRCVWMILVSSLVPAAAVLAILRRGAPRSPARAGAACGLLAGAMGSGIFALSCPNDSALFVSVWYVGAVAALALVGGLVGRRLLAW